MRKITLIACLLISLTTYSQEWKTFWATGKYKYSIKHLDNKEARDYLKEVKTNNPSVEIYKRLLFKYDKPKEVAKKEAIRFIKSAQKKRDTALVKAYQNYAYVVYEMNYICESRMYKLLKVYHYNDKNKIIDSINLKGKVNWKIAKENSPMDAVTKYGCITTKD